MREASKEAVENPVSKSQDALLLAETRSFNLRTKPLPPTPTSSPPSSSPTGKHKEHDGSPRPKSFPNLESLSSSLRCDKRSPRPISEGSPKKLASDFQASYSTNQPERAITSQAPTSGLEAVKFSPRPKRVSSLLSPPKLYPGALYPSPPTQRPVLTSPTKVSFSNTVSLLMASEHNKALDLRTHTPTKIPDNQASISNPKIRSPSKFRIAEFLVRKDDDSKGSRHSVGKRKTGQTPTNPGSVNTVTEFGKVEPGQSKCSNQRWGVGKENEVLEGLGAMSRNTGSWKGKIGLGGKRKRFGKGVLLSQSSNKQLQTSLEERKLD